jgi:type IV pilus assembly protein PilM
MSVGLDIGSKTIKIVELVKEGQRFKLKGSGIVTYSGRRIEQIKDDKELASLSEIIRKLHKEAKISTKEVAIALPESRVFTKMISFPLLTDAEIASAVKWEAEQHIPIPIQEAIVQHQIVERREDLTPPRVSVLLVAAPRSLVEKYVGVVQVAKLSVVAVETGLISLVRALAPKDQTVLLVDFGAISTDIAIAARGKLSFSRSIPTAGEAFTRAVVQSFNVEYGQAEQYKKTYGLSGEQLEGKIKAALEPTVRMVVDEIKKAIHFYQSEEKGEAPTSVILSGGTAEMPEMISYLSQALGIEVVVGNPFTDIVVESQADKKLVSFAPLYSIAVGLAKIEE